jgi:hypothetical protein
MKILFFLCCLFASIGFSQSHEAFTSLLSKHVSNEGWVDYKELKKDKDNLRAYLTFLSQNVPDDNASKEEQLSFYINVYNAATLSLVVDHYPVESIKDIGGLFQSPFKQKFIRLGNETYSLDDIEKGILLPMGEPRVHFAINCASYSCPKLLNKAFETSTLYNQLEQVTKAFILSDENEISPNSLQLSKLFQWYKSDFESENQSLIDFLNRYATIQIQPNARISYKAYNWSLNKQHK